MTAMVWGPNVGINYPYKEGGQPLPPTNSANFKALDTNNDGVINFLDDPYLPFYPGDIHVDWVGLSLYWYPTDGVNNFADNTFFADQLTATGPSTSRYQPSVLNQPNRNFYQRFCIDRKKPLIIPETAAPFIPSWRTGDATESDLKMQWLGQILSDATLARFPKLKGLVWFEELKQDAGFQLRDWRISDNVQTRTAFVQEVKLRVTSQKLGSATNFKIDCSGKSSLDFSVV
jgi:hypothetical protein